MSALQRLPALLRLRPPPPSSGWLGLRLLLASLPLVILLVDGGARNTTAPLLLGGWGTAALLFTSITLIAHHLSQRHLVRILSVVAMVLSVRSIVQAGHFSAPVIAYWPVPGGFLWSLLPLFCLLLSLALFGASVSSRRHSWAMLHICLGVAIGALTAVGVVGEIHELLRWFDLDHATTRTVLLRGLVGLSLGASLALGETSLRLSLVTLRRWAHVAAMVAVLFLAILIAELLRLEEIRDLRGAVRIRAAQVIDQLESQFRVSTYEMRRMARASVRVERGGPAPSDRVEAWNYLETTPELQALVQVDTEFVVQWSVPALRYPELKAGQSVDRRLNDAVQSPGRFSAEPVVTDALRIPDMGHVFVYLVPTLQGRMTDGFLAGFFRVDTFVSEAIGRSADRFGVIVQDEKGDAVYQLGREDLASASAYVVSLDWELAGSEWRVHVFPRHGMLVDGFTIMPLLILVLGALLAVTFGITLYQAAFARVSMRRLQREVDRRARLETELRDYQRNLEDVVAQRTRELEQSNRELKRVARTDALTGVLNRGRFEEEFETLLTRAQRYRRPLTLCLLDLDHFKSINDNHGHAVGDEVLRRVCAICRPILRDADVFARYGGEEFAILMEQADIDTASQVAERMRATLEDAPVKLKSGLELHVTGSFGLATVTEETGNRKQLFQQADQALYRAKANGRNRVETWTPGESADAD